MTLIRSLFITTQIFIPLVVYLFVSSTARADAEIKILIVGDSLTAGYGVAQDDAYPAQLEKLLNQKSKKYKVVAAGSSGATSASALQRIRWHLKSKPSVLILALGANDGLRGFPITATRKNLTEAIRVAKKENIRVVLAGMQMPINYGEDYRRDFQKLYKEIADEEKILLIPFLLEGVGGEPTLNQADGIHPNEKGHKIMAQNLFAFLENKL